MNGQLGVIYMLHFDRPYRHARHYVGWTEDLIDRLERHAAGRGARLVEVIWQAGIGFTAIRICEGTRRTERAIKKAGGSVRYCPICTPHPRNGQWAPLDSEFVRCVYPNPNAKGGSSSCLTPAPAVAAATSATTPTSSTSCSSASTAARLAPPGGGAPS